MKAFVIYLVVFYFVAVLIRGQKHISSARYENYFHNPFLEKQRDKFHTNLHNINHSNYKLNKPRLILDISFSSASKLKPIEK